jgi:hypothetical protein
VFLPLLPFLPQLLEVTALLLQRPLLHLLHPRSTSGRRTRRLCREDPGTELSEGQQPAPHIAWHR